PDPHSARPPRTAPGFGLSPRRGAPFVARKLHSNTRPRHSRRVRLAPERSRNGAASRSAAPLCACSTSAPSSPPATAAPAPIAPRIRASRLASGIAQERPDLRDSGAVHHPAGLRGLQRKPRVERIEYGQLEGGAAVRWRQQADRKSQVPHASTPRRRRVRKHTSREEPPTGTLSGKTR